MKRRSLPCFNSSQSPRSWLVCLLGLLCVQSLQAETIYQTDFDNFPVGDDKWHGTDGWVSNATSGGVQAIDSDVIIGGGLGNTASLGFNRPPSTFTTVFRPMNVDPAEAGTGEVEIELLMGIQDSTNNIRDSFYVSIYNMDGDFLGSLRFSNEDASYGIWRSDGTEVIDTGIDFIRGELHVIDISLNLEANLWSASIDGLPMFTDETLTSRSNRERTLGPLAIEWQLSQRFASLHGDNWFLLADLRVDTAIEAPDPVGTEPFAITEISKGADGQVTVHWPGDPGFVYQVEYSEDLQTWKRDLPASLISAASSSGSMSFADNEPGNSRHYRVIRSVATAALLEKAVQP